MKKQSPMTPVAALFSARALAKQLAAALFDCKDPSGKRAERLALMYRCAQGGEHMGGGLCEAAVVEKLFQVLTEKAT